MNIAQRLHTILQHNWDYAQALELYNEIGTNQVVKFTCKLSNNSFNQDLLQRELAELVPQYPFETEKKAVPAIKSGQLMEEEEKPEQLQKLEKEWKELYRKANHIRIQLFANPSADKRREMAHQVLNLMDQVKRVWGAVEYFREHQVMPPEFQEAQVMITDRADMMKRINNLSTYITKAKGGKKFKMTLPEMEAERAELKRRLN